MEHPLLELKDVSLSYHNLQGETPAISHISFQVPKGRFLSIVGPSGCGKSTILNLICGLLHPEEGEILMHGTRMAEKPTNIGYMLQKDHLFEWRTVYNNILLGLETQKRITPEKLSYIDTLMETYGLTAFKNSRPSELSGGMRQRAALIRTLALEPELLLLDEPFSALDYQTRLYVSDDIGKIIKQEEKTAILVTHDISEAISMADTVIVLTKRPASVQCVIPIDLELPDRTPLTSRNAPLFKLYFNRIWKELNQNE